MLNKLHKMELTVDNLRRVLTDTLERNSEGKLAENQLKAWSNGSNYHYFLQSVYLDQALPLQVRWLSVIQFKNGVEKYWRSGKKHVIPLEEKQAIIGRVFDNIAENNSQLMIQNAHSIARIARVDFPTSWPNIFAQIEHLLLQAFNEKNYVKCYNVLTILNQVVKNIGQVRIGKAKIAMQSKMPIITPIVMNMSSFFFKEWIHDFSVDPMIVDVDYLCLKVLRRILVVGYSSPHNEMLVKEFFKSNLANFQTLMVQYNKLDESSPIVEKIKGFLKCQGKLYYNFAYSHANSFVLLDSFLHTILLLLNILETQASRIYENMDDTSDDIWSVIAIKSLLILKKIITLNNKGEPTLIKSNITKLEIRQASDKLKLFLTNDVILPLTELVINWYLKLRPVDLETWNENPEEFVNEDLSESWEYQIRPCAENFFQHLMVSYKDLLVPFVMNKVNDINAKVSTLGYDLPLILLKDSLFAIIQLSGVAIADMVDFDTFLVNILIPSLSAASDSSKVMELKILKRRTCLIINEWVSIKCSRENRIEIYKLLLSFLNSETPDNNDKVLQLTTVQTLKNVIEEWDFNKQDFKPYSSLFINKLVLLLDSMELVESKLFILNGLNAILERNGSYIDKSELGNLFQAYPEIWAYFESHSESLMIKNVLIRTLKNLIKCFQDSKVTSDISLQIVNTCCTYTSDYYSVLSEDGFELWQAVVEHYPFTGNIEQDTVVKTLVFDMFPLIYEPLLNTTEILPLILSIIRSYFILIPMNVLIGNPELKQLLTGILSTVASNLALMRDDSLDIVLSILDVLFVKLYNFYSPLQLKNDGNPGIGAFYEVLKESGLFKVLVEIIADEENNSILTINKLLLTLARIFYSNSNLTVELLKNVFPSGNETAIFKQLLNNWLINSKNIFDARKKKQNLLGLSSILAITEDALKPVIFIRENINLLFSMWSTYLDEINENDQGDCTAYYKNFNYYEFDLMFTNNQEVKNNTENVNYAELEMYRMDETEEFKRYEQLLLNYDPIHKVNLKAFIASLLGHLETEFGTKTYRQILSFVDEGFLEQLQMKMGVAK